MLGQPIAARAVERLQQPASQAPSSPPAQESEDIMLKRSLLLMLGIVALVALSWSEGAVAKLSANGINLGNGISLGNGINLHNGIEISTTALQAARLALPDGTEVNFR
jgi:hypothetical protein